MDESLPANSPLRHFKLKPTGTGRAEPALKVPPQEIPVTLVY